MERLLLILILFAPVDLLAGRHLFLLTQKEYTFQADGELWAQFFKNHNSGSIEVTRLKEYSTIEVVSIFSDYRSRLSTNDTLIIILSAHTVRYSNCTLLQYPDEADIFDMVVWDNTYKTFLDAVSEKGVRVLFIINSCEPKTVINPALAYKLKGLTIVYADEEYSINIENMGSLMSVLIREHRFYDMRTCIDWVNDRYLDKSLYFGKDKTINTMISESYPQKTTMYGTNYTF